MQHIQSLAAMLLAYLVLIIWRDIYSFSCVVLIIPVVIMGMIMIGLFQFTMKKKICLAACYFQSSSLLYKIMTGRIFVFIRSILMALLLTGMLLIQVMLWDWIVLLALFFNIFLLYGFYIVILNKLQFIINANMRFIIAKNWAVVLNVLMMITVLASIQYYSLIPDYLSPSLTETLDTATARFNSECNIVHYLLQMGAQKDAFSWWLMVTGTDWISEKWAKIMIWIVFLLSGGLAIWGYNRYLIEVAALLNHKEEIK